MAPISPLGLTKTLDAEQSAGVGPHLLLVLSLASKAAHTHWPVIVQMQARAPGDQVRVHHRVHQGVSPLLRSLHNSPGQQRQRLHPPDIDIEVSVDDAGVDAVNLHTLALKTIKC